MDIVETDVMPKDENIPNPETNDMDNIPETEIPVTSAPPAKAPSNLSRTDSSPVPDPATGSTLEKVLALHTSRRMKVASTSASNSPKYKLKKPKQGVSIPSQRRFLLYWSLLLSGTAPTHLWPLTPPPVQARPRIKLRQITVRLREAGSAKMTMVKVVNAVLDKAAKGRSYSYGPDEHIPRKGDLWISLARYDDELVELLENCERQTRDRCHLGKRHKDGGVETESGKGITNIFEGGEWDQGKMVRSFARLGRVDQEVGVQEDEQVRSRRASSAIYVEGSIEKTNIHARPHAP